MFKKDLRKVFDKILNENGGLIDTSKNITLIYKTNVEQLKDTFGNSYVNIDYSKLEESLTKQFNRSMNDRENLKFDIIAKGLVNAWKYSKTDKQVLPINFSSISNINILSNINVFENQLSGVSRNSDNIVNAFNNIFIMHLSSISHIYNGIDTSSKPITITSKVIM